MALLLAMYQKMRLIREKNQVTLDLTKYSSKLERVTKNIENVQKRYTSLFTQIEQRATRMKNDSNQYVRESLGLGTNNINTNNLWGMHPSVSQTIYQILMSTENGNPGYPQSIVDAMMNEYSQYGRFRLAVDPNTNKEIPGKFACSPDITQEHIDRFQFVRRYAEQDLSNRNMTLQQCQANVENNASIWLEAQKEQLEAEQDAALEPLKYQETMWELEKNQADAKLKRINANLETYEQLCSQEAEKSAPTFGLR